MMIMKHKPGDFIIYKYEKANLPRNNGESPTKETYFHYGIIERVVQEQTLDGEISHYLVGGVRIKEEEVISKIMTEK